MFGQCVWHCPQQSVACVHCYLLHSSFQHIASADQSTKFHRLMFWGGREMDVIVTLNSRPFLINMDSTQRTTHMTIFEGRQWWGGRDNQKEIKRLILGSHSHLFSIVNFNAATLHGGTVCTRLSKGYQPTVTFLKSRVNMNDRYDYTWKGSKKQYSQYHHFSSTDSLLHERE